MAYPNTPVSTGERRWFLHSRLQLLAMQMSNLSLLGHDDGYKVTAFFDNIGGLKEKSAVRISGVLIGRVTAIDYDNNKFRAKVTLTIHTHHDYLSTDTQASIYTSGLLGEQYIALEPGAETEILRHGSVIEFTQSALVLEEIVGNIMVKLTSK